jgi:hypothetical protein
MNTNSLSRLGVCYALPEGVEADSVEAMTYLAGAHRFGVKELEVFEV